MARDIILKSNNTGHIWDITCQDNPRGRSLIINHKHNETDPYHVQPQMHPQTITEAQEMIKKHDEWQKRVISYYTFMGVVSGRNWCVPEDLDEEEKDILHSPASELRVIEEDTESVKLISPKTGQNADVSCTLFRYRRYTLVSHKYEEYDYGSNGKILRRTVRICE